MNTTQIGNPNAARTGILIVLVTLAVGCGLGFFSYYRYRHSVQTMEDLFTAFVYFLEETDGRFPASASDLFNVGIAHGFIEKLPDDGFRVHPRRENQFRPHAYSVEIRNLDKLGVAWGSDLGAMSYEEPLSIVRDKDGNDALLIGDITSIKGRRWFTYDLLRVRADLLDEEIPTFVRTKEHPEGRAMPKKEDA
ncbi:MAG: hypothetical protein AB7N71_03880 [Phycisphaerae bacterium]